MHFILFLIVCRVSYKQHSAKQRLLETACIPSVFLFAKCLFSCTRQTEPLLSPGNKKLGKTMTLGKAPVLAEYTTENTWRKIHTRQRLWWRLSKDLVLGKAGTTCPLTPLLRRGGFVECLQSDTQQIFAVYPTYNTRKLFLFFFPFLLCSFILYLFPPFLNPSFFLHSFSLFLSRHYFPSFLFCHFFLALSLPPLVPLYFPCFLFLTLFRPFSILPSLFPSLFSHLLSRRLSFPSLFPAKCFPGALLPPFSFSPHHPIYNVRTLWWMLSSIDQNFVLLAPFAFVF